MVFAFCDTLLSLVKVNGGVVAWTDYLGRRVAVAKVSWHDLPGWMRIVYVLMIVGWCFVMGALLTVGQIETAAIWQPSTPDGIYRYPHDIKGSVRYFSDGQERLYGVARPLMVGGFALMLPVSGMFIYILRRLNERRRQEALEDIWKRLEERN